MGGIDEEAELTPGARTCEPLDPRFALLISICVRGGCMSLAPFSSVACSWSQVVPRLSKIWTNKIGVSVPLFLFLSMLFPPSSCLSFASLYLFFISYLIFIVSIRFSFPSPSGMLRSKHSCWELASCSFCLLSKIGREQISGGDMTLCDMPFSYFYDISLCLLRRAFWLVHLRFISTCFPLISVDT